VECDPPPSPFQERPSSSFFLGKPIGFAVCPPTSTINGHIAKAKTILGSVLAPWQKLDALRTFFFPSLQFSMRMGMLPKSDWLQLDKELRGELKAVLNIPVKATNRYLYGSAAAGCCNVPLDGEVSDVMLADGAFKLLTSADLRVAELADAHLRETVFSRISRSPTSADLGPQPALVWSGNSTLVSCHCRR
jgi:hypothetical protein